MGDKKAMWIRFFRDAGIPGGFDVKYAVVFDQNRMRMDMLSDLSKELLKDMGITAMGDILTILKHAKRVEDETKAQEYDVPQPTSTVREKPPSTTTTSSSPKVSLSSSSRSSAAPSSSTPAPAPIIKRIITTPPSSISKVQERSVRNNSPLKRTIEGRSSSGTTTIGSISRSVVRPLSSISSVSPLSSSGRKPLSTSGGGGTIVKLKRSVSPPQREEVPLQKKIRVLPEQEGKYIVKMPQGSNSRTQNFLQSRLGPISTTTTAKPSSSVSVSEKKHGVFSRLGDSRVSSTSDEVSQTQRTKSSVFSRLGNKTMNPQKSLVGPSTSIHGLSTRDRDQDRIDLLKTKLTIRNDMAKSTMSRMIPNNNDFDRPRGSNMRTAVSTGGIRSRLGGRERESPNSNSSSSHPVSSISPRTNDIRMRMTASSGTSRPADTTAPKIQSKVASTKPEPSVQRQVIREERFVNAEGKTMIRKIVMKTVRKKK